MWTKNAGVKNEEGSQILEVKRTWVENAREECSGGNHRSGKPRKIKHTENRWGPIMNLWKA